jgi:hypothetical protein
MDRAMGLRDTPLSWLVLAGGATGALGGLFLQWWTNAKDYPLLISGKPLWSLPANIPVAFELTILLAALAAVGGLLMLTRLPRFRHPVLKSKYFRRMTSDRFALCIESTDPSFDSSKTSAFLASLGGTAVERVEA